mmetsp:Transcript_47921/g.125466  ORF Transcript_47921/g.125466 Transcript_47921/m.125466 type:complete len:227 (-) Transcript_47921:2241-2921(-)
MSRTVRSASALGVASVPFGDAGGEPPPRISTSEEAACFNSASFEALPGAMAPAEEHNSSCACTLLSPPISGDVDDSLAAAGRTWCFMTKRAEGTRPDKAPRFKRCPKRCAMMPDDVDIGTMSLSLVWGNAAGARETTRRWRTCIQLASRRLAFIAVPCVISGGFANLPTPRHLAQRISTLGPSLLRTLPTTRKSCLRFSLSSKCFDMELERKTVTSGGTACSPMRM